MGQLQWCSWMVEVFMGIVIAYGTCGEGKVNDKFGSCNNDYSKDDNDDVGGVSDKDDDDNETHIYACAHTHKHNKFSILVLPCCREFTFVAT